MSYSYFLKQARRKAKLSLREAASRLQIPPSSLFRYEEGLILHIPPDRLYALFHFYQIDPQKLRREHLCEGAAERLYFYEKSQRPVDAGFLYEQYSLLDERGQRTILRLLLHEAEVSARLRQVTPPQT